MNTRIQDSNIGSLFVICLPPDLPAWENIVKCIELFESVQPDSLLFSSENFVLFITDIESSDVSHWYRKLAKQDIRISKPRFTVANFSQRVFFFGHTEQNQFINSLTDKYVSKRISYYLKYEEIFTGTLGRPITKQRKTEEQCELAASVKTQQKCKISKGHPSFCGNVLNADNQVLKQVKAYLKNVHIISYQKVKKRPTLVDKGSRQGSEVSDWEGDTVSLLYAEHRGGNRRYNGGLKVKWHKRKRRKLEILPLHKVTENEINEDHAFFTSKKPRSKEDEISLKLLQETTSLNSAGIKHLRNITNLPLRRYPWRISQIIAYPGRRKKNERPTERRPQRNQARDTAPVQATPDDPTPGTGDTLPRDRYALPSQPENRNLQHLLPTFAPRVEPMSASTQQLRRLSFRPRYQQYADETARRTSFTLWPPDTGQNSENMVTNGFFYTGRDDLIRCYMCGIGLKDWSADDEPLFEHVRHSPDCPFLFNFLGQDVLDAYKAALLPGRARPAARTDSQGSQGATNRPEGVPTESGDSSVAPRNPEFAELRQRIDSFHSWPREVTQTPRQLAEAGFFHTGDADTVRCFQCDGGLRRWDPRDDPWIEHTRWFPHCQYVRQIKGVDYVELVQRAIRETAGEEEEEEPLGDTIGAMANLTVQPPSQKPPEPEVTIQTILGMGYSRAALQEAVRKADEKGMENFTPKDLLEILLEMRNEGELAPPEPVPKTTQESQGATGEIEDDPLFVTIENKGLRKVLKCSECKIRDKNILFLPCTHHLLCEECAEKVNKCPQCDTDINRKIKTYMS